MLYQGVTWYAWQCFYRQSRVGRDGVKPAYWIAILALLGAVVGYAIFKVSGVADAKLGAVIGIAIGTIVYYRRRKKLA